jgi:hypothetical protein
MAKIKADIVGSSYEMRATQLDSQTCINWYLTVDQTGKYPITLLPRPGLQLLIDDNNENNNVRGLLSLRGFLYAVIDEKLYECSSTGRREEVGVLNTASGLIYFLANQFQLFISDGTLGYVYQLKETEFHEKGDFFIVDNYASNISNPVFSGGGVDDLSVSPISDYTGDKEKLYRVQIDDTTSGTADNFRWSEDGGFTWNQERVIITGTDQELNEKIFINFDNLKGHVLFDTWDIKAVPSSDFYAPIIPSYQDGYGIYPRQNTNTFYVTAINDFSLVNAAEFQNTSVYPDNLVAAISIHDELYLIGETTTEIWYDTGAPEFPFERKRNIILNYGCEAPFSVASGADNIIFMLASNYDGGRVIVKIVNYNVQIISTEPLNEYLRSYDVIKDAFAFIIERNGHIFYIITFPTADRTWVYDLTTDLWHEWRSLRFEDRVIDPSIVSGRFRGNCHTVFEGQDVIGDAYSGKIYILTEKSSVDFDRNIVCERSTRNLNQDNQFLSLNSLQIDVEAGRGEFVPEREDPQIMLQISKDGGRTWGNELWRSLGKHGEFRKRAIWYRLGTARNFNFRIRISDPVYRVIMGGIADVEIFD